MTDLRRSAILLAGLGSAAMLAAAFAFQHWGGLAPCQLCLWQRWPHAAAVIVLALWLITRWRWLGWLGALAALTTAGIGVFHMGVEEGWWQFLSSCTQGSIAGETGAALLPGSGAEVAPPIRCDRVPWSLLGLSMATWNAIASTGLAALWAFGATRRG